MSAGAIVGRVVDRDGDTRYVNVADDAPDAVVDSLECDAGANRVAVPEAFVADDDGDRVRLVV